jgi:CubicO group peptidase (beta-lactamase class C family)
MKRRIVVSLCRALAAAAAPAGPAGPGGNDELLSRRVRGQAIERLVESGGETPLQQFIDEQLAPEYRDSIAPGALLEQLRKIRAACAGYGGVRIEVQNENTRITFLQETKETSVLFRLEPDPPHRIASLTLEPTRQSERRTPELPPFTWDSLTQRLDAAAKDGFSGTVLVARDGKVVLHQGYGLADREHGRPITTETIYAIGSVPIDFTKAAILKLAELGKLSTSDPIGKFFPEVPADKRAITIGHLMTGRSGLPNFHHIPGTDADPDLTWIDRPTAIKRILDRALLFPPGEGRAHSHSAWVLLAAVVEIASGQPYGEFLQQHFFARAGMTRTGLHEDAARFDDEAFAIGYGGDSAGKLNIPKYWGPTSWLVMGSGGMESTPHDLYLWQGAMRAGKLLSPEGAAKYFTGGVLAGGDDRGFLCMYNDSGPENIAIVCGNAHRGGEDITQAVAVRLTELASGTAALPFALGIQFAVESEHGVSVAEVVPGGAAERDGLKAGDVLISANGQPMRDPILPLLEPSLRTGDPITFEIERAGQRSKVTVRPKPRAMP